MNRPVLFKGDLVKRKKPNDDGRMYKVVKVTVPKLDQRRLRVWSPTSSEGFVEVTVKDKSGHKFTFRRRELWRIPNQPKGISKKDRNGQSLVTMAQRVLQSMGWDKSTTTRSKP